MTRNEMATIGKKSLKKVAGVFGPDEKPVYRVEGTNYFISLSSQGYSSSCFIWISETGNFEDRKRIGDGEDLGYTAWRLKFL